MRKSLDLLKGEKFGRLTILMRISGYGGNSIMLCDCSCGNKHKARWANIARGATTSCGCKERERIEKMAKVGIFKNVKNIPEYSVWRSMIERCYNKNRKDFKEYGGRGITVCEKWLGSFISFFEDMGKRPGDEYAIERIENNGNYCKENCRWDTKKNQARNRRNNRIIELEGSSRTVAEWSCISGVKYTTILYRLSAKWCPKDAIFSPSRRIKHERSF